MHLHLHAMRRPKNEKVFLSDLFTSYTTGIMVVSVRWMSIDKTALQRELLLLLLHPPGHHNIYYNHQSQVAIIPIPIRISRPSAASSNDLELIDPSNSEFLLPA